MKLNGSYRQTTKRIFLFGFVLVFSFNFLYQRIMDNEVNCGSLGSPESGCPYAFLDHTLGMNPGHDLGEDGDHSEHVCISCPCNLIVSVTWDLYLSHVLIQLHKIYFQSQELQFPKLVATTFLFRPPKVHLTS